MPRRPACDRDSGDQGPRTKIPSLAELHKNGSGIKLDKKKAERLYRMAADRNEAVAQYSLARLLHSEQKHEETFRYLTLSANQGLTKAEFQLSCCYRNGKGTEVDLEQAAYWVLRAADKGDEQAVEYLADLDRGAREAAAS